MPPGAWVTGESSGTGVGQAKPITAILRPRPARTCRAKRSQFRRWQLRGRCPGREDSCETNPISAHPVLAYLGGCAPRGIEYAEARGVRRREEAVQGRGRYARTRRWSSIATTSRPLPTLCRRRFMGRTLGKTAHTADSYGKSPMEGFAFLLPAPSACARSLLVPGTCDLTPRRTDASDSAAHGAWKGPHIPAP